MGLLDALRRAAGQPGGGPLTPAQRERRRRLDALPPAALHPPHEAVRYVTVDVETTGLDMQNDHVLSIGAVAVEGRRIQLAACFEVVLRQAESSSVENILVHRIGGQRQLAGKEPADALLDFLDYVHGAPLVAFRAEFDRHMIDRALRELVGTRTRGDWLDLAVVLPALVPGNDCRTMDDWLERLGVRMLARHDALADALATAQMLLVALHLADGLDMTRPADLLAMQKAQRWLGRR